MGKDNTALIFDHFTSPLLLVMPLLTGIFADPGIPNFEIIGLKGRFIRNIILSFPKILVVPLEIDDLLDFFAPNFFLFLP